ncbi:MAG: acyltransferase family protein [Limisphaerales bacterium]
MAKVTEPSRKAVAAAEAGEPGHLGFLDGVRGLAALWVVVGHCMIFGGWVWAKFPEPVIAVDVFMFVSGYLMVHQWTRRVGDGWAWNREAAIEFWIRRFFRIVPVYYLVLGLMFLNWDTLAEGFKALQSANPGRWSGQPAYDPANWDDGPKNWVLRLTFLFGLLPGYAASSFTGDWSLSLEMQFYAVFPLALMAMRRWGPAPLAWGAVLIALAVREATLRLQGLAPGTQLIYPLPSLLLLKMPVFLVGMIVAEVNRSLRGGIEPARSMRNLVLALVVASLSSWHIVVVAALTFHLVAPAVGPSAGGPSSQNPTGTVRRWLGQALGNRLMTFLADASYSVYLVHSLVIPVAGGWLLKQPWFEAMPGRSRVGVLLAVVLGVTYPVAFVLHHGVERPGIELGRRIVRRLANSRIDGPKRAP